MAGKIEVVSGIAIDERDIRFRFTRSSGPGGQNVNKVSTAVQLRYNLREASLPAYVKRKLIKIGGNRVTRDREVIIEARGFRSQERNRQDALRRLVKLVARAARRPKPRLPTKPTAGDRQRRLEEKKKRGQRKKDRGDLTRRKIE